VLFFGALGWVMEKLAWPRPPVLLGLVLGPLAENRLFLSTDNYGLAWTHRPGVMLIFALTLFGIFYPMIKERRQAKAKTADQLEPTTTETQSATLHFGPSALFTLSVVVLLALALWQSRNFGFRAGLFPWAIGIPTIILACAQLARDLYGKKKKTSTNISVSFEQEVAPTEVKRRTISIILWTIGFFLAIWLLGFSYAVPLTMVAYLALPARERWTMVLSVSFFTWLFYWGLFEKMLNVPFPEGLLIRMIYGGQ
jgi:putative tricarboxylic transport membrane protein